MIFPLGWLTDYLKIDVSAEELGEMLTMAGLELEALEDKGKALGDVCVAQINSIEKHPNADRLSVCEITDGQDRYAVVCGADNMKEGDKVAFAKAGTVLPATSKFPEGVKIKRSKIRGEDSEGMLCSADEMGLSGGEDGIMILSSKAELGTSMSDQIGYDGVIFEVGITPNRPDCMSIFGIAREVSAILGENLQKPSFSIKEGEKGISERVTVELEDTEACPRYCCRLIEGVRIEPSPSWLRERLEHCGIRSVNNVVDVTNFVLLEQGQPLHAFDCDKLDRGSISVRKAGEGETIETLDGIGRELLVEDLVICSGDRPVALAGIMGGADSEIDDATSSVLLEAAYFSPVGIRKTSRRNGLKSESSSRFEKGVDINNVLFALDRAAELISRLSGGTVAQGLIDVYPDPVSPREISLSVDRVCDLVGISTDSHEIAGLLEGLEFEVLSLSDDALLLRVPTFRVDIEREVDIVEEVARLLGYDNIPSVLPEVPMVAKKPNVITVMEKRLRDIFVSYGFLEAINYSFESPELLRTFGFEESIHIMNPISRELSEMRMSLLPSLVKNVRLNLSRQNQDVRLFESGKVFYPKDMDQLPNEVKKFAAIATGKRAPEIWDGEKFDFFDIKSVLERSLEVLSVDSRIDFESISPDHGFLWPGKSSAVLVDGNVLGVVGELHPHLLEKLEISESVYVLELDLSLLSVVYTSFERKFSPLPKFPSLRRDIALVVDDAVPVREILSVIKKADSGIIENAWVFDVYKGNSLEKGKKSVALSLILRNRERTLTDEDANRVQQDVLKSLEKTIGAELRSV
ncbi:MAG: phenylalanine--tRNA ligase subunit beta [Candidatus Dadabacteria bacterium]|nr:phenylalanine--tRNA ligase subunit beta [Candidatus Dadabacteria bacterium]